ncbi:hypothetical protein QDA11_gp66 [Microbacterium phage Jayden]|uniref:Uncharacterized protein n=1 Tax=Microbacterium phage Jayden TaxID=2656550 RepID=A0A649VTG6_9CAUD|nr:hypothetical protein QDA11_gp66 [Microbacterium phage Jayden]QGJ95285.1 hypothetical protein PBI_JAYDEN_66 [Microbacterium phage Jayden]
MSLPELASYIIVGAICLLAGCALGNFTAHSDNERTNRGRPE